MSIKIPARKPRTTAIDKRNITDFHLNISLVNLRKKRKPFLFQPHFISPLLFQIQFVGKEGKQRKERKKRFLLTSNYAMTIQKIPTWYVIISLFLSFFLFRFSFFSLSFLGRSEKNLNPQRIIFQLGKNVEF